MSDRDKFEEAHALLTKVVEDVGHLLPYRSVIEWWVEANKPASTDEQIAELEAMWAAPASRIDS